MARGPPRARDAGPHVKRSSIKRKKPLKQKKPLRRRSKKMEAKYDGPSGRRALVAALLKEHPICQAGARIGAHLGPEHGRDVRLSDGVSILLWERCTRRSKHVHEILARSAGGSILDRSNVLCVCPGCHDWVGRFPRAAVFLGLRKSRYGRTA